MLANAASSSIHVPPRLAKLLDESGRLVFHPERTCFGRWFGEQTALRGLLWTKSSAGVVILGGGAFAGVALMFAGIFISGPLVVASAVVAFCVNATLFAIRVDLAIFREAVFLSPRYLLQAAIAVAASVSFSAILNNDMRGVAFIAFYVPGVVFLVPGGLPRYARELYTKNGSPTIVLMMAAMLLIVNFGALPGQRSSVVLYTNTWGAHPVVVDAYGVFNASAWSTLLLALEDVSARLFGGEGAWDRESFAACYVEAVDEVS